MTMNVLHVDEQLGWRGGEQQASWLIQGLVRRGHRVTVAGRRRGAFLASDHGGSQVERISLPFSSELDLWSAWRLARVVKNRAIDILHAHTSHAHTAACLARMLARRGKVVVSRRVSFAPKPHALNRWKYGLPDRFISVSGKVDEVLEEYGIDTDRREVVYSSVDPARLEVAPISRGDLGVPESVPLLVTAGALVGHKDIETLVAAMPLVLAQFSEARLVVAGEGELRPAIEAKIAQLGLAAAITMLGHRTDAPSIIRAGDVYVSSSWSEGLGTSVLEALACKTPVVATRAGGVPEMVLDGETGYLVPNRDPEALGKAVVDSLRNRDHARAMAEKGRELVEKQFVVERMIEGTIRVYEKVLA